MNKSFFKCLKLFNAIQSYINQLKKENQSEMLINYEISNQN